MRFINSLTLLNVMIVSVAGAWVLLASVNFSYGLWHDIGGIKEGIERFAPQNRYKQHFEHTTKMERVRVFRETVVAIHSGGKGLKDINYYARVASNNDEQSAAWHTENLYREPEIEHLHDVAKLINFAAVFALASLVCLIVGVLYLRHCFRTITSSKEQTPSPTLPNYLMLSIKKQWLFLALFLLASGVILIIFGFEPVFNQLHIWVFPAENQWFFYYQDSLMSTMMLAPRLFALIGAQWLAASLMILFVLQKLIKLIIRF